MSLSRDLVQISAEEIAAIPHYIALNYRVKNYYFNDVRIHLQTQFDDFIFALARLKRRHTSVPNLTNDVIDTTINQALVLANELVDKKSLGMSADKAFPILTAHIIQMCQTIDNPDAAQINALNKSIEDMQTNLLYPMHKYSKWANRSIAALLMIIGVSLVLSALVLGPIMLSIGVSTLVADFIFGGALPALMLGTFSGVCSAILFEHSENKLRVNHEITLFGKSSKEVLTNLPEIAAPQFIV
jgi:hypothetical protein